MKAYQWILKPLIFVILTAVVVSGVQRVFRTGDRRIYQMEASFYSEPDNSLDAVYIGASNVYPFFQAPLAWNDFGIAVHPYTIPGMMPQAVKYIVKEVHKTQPDTLYIINLNTYKSSIASDAKWMRKIHYIADYMPWSVNKIQLINALCDAAEIKGTDRLEYFFPIIRFHSGWSELEEDDFVKVPNGMKAASVYESFFVDSTDVSDQVSYSDDIGNLTATQLRLLGELLDYCDENELHVLFVTVPQAIEEKKVLDRFNAMEQLVQERGYDCLDLMESTDEIGLRMDKDYIDIRHTNLHGSIKYTYYLGQYLAETYALADKRGDTAYESWDASVDPYIEIISGYALPFEISHDARDDALQAPKLAALTKTEKGTRLSWQDSEGASGYEIYRKSTKTGDGAWKLLDTVNADQLSYIDEKTSSKVTYTYTVVPVKTVKGKVYRGDFEFAGVSGKGGKK